LFYALVVFILTACAPPSAGATGEPSQDELEAVLQAPPTVPNGNSVEMEFTLTNNFETGIYVLTWYTPLEGVLGEIFRIERDGQPIPYEGPLVMRGDPIPEDYVFLDAGAAVSATVDLAIAYDFSQPGEYSISFISPQISHVAMSEDEMVASVEDLGPVEIGSESIIVEIEE
jgi:hypothetical protein